MNDLHSEEMSKMEYFVLRVSGILKVVAAGMAIALVVLLLFNNISIRTILSFLAITILCLALSQVGRKTRVKRIK